MKYVQEAYLKVVSSITSLHYLLKRMCTNSCSEGNGIVVHYITKELAYQRKKYPFCLWINLEVNYKIK